jgi:hypothetical protein
VGWQLLTINAITLKIMEIKTLMLALLVPAITGLAFIAYKHPLGFRKIAIGLAYLLTLFLICIFAYSYGSSSSSVSYLKEQLQSSPNDKISSFEYNINNAFRCKEVTNTTIVVYFISMVYLAFLYFLPYILGIQIQQKSNTTNNE